MEQRTDMPSVPNEEQPVGYYLCPHSGEMRADRRAPDRPKDSPEVRRLFDGFRNVIANADPYWAAYVTKVQAAVARLLSPIEKTVSFCGGVPPKPYEPQKMDWDWADVPQEGQPVDSAKVPPRLWTIQSPEGRTFQAGTLLGATKCAREATTTVPPAEALQRIMAACAWSAEDEKELQDHMQTVRGLIAVGPVEAKSVRARLDLLDQIEASARKLMGYPS
jgi:hypothetical protein